MFDTIEVPLIVTVFVSLVAAVYFSNNKGDRTVKEQRRLTGGFFLLFMTAAVLLASESPSTLIIPGILVLWFGFLFLAGDFKARSYDTKFLLAQLEAYEADRRRRGGL